jgi:hypothetical protein
MGGMPIYNNNGIPMEEVLHISGRHIVKFRKLQGVDREKVSISREGSRWEYSDRSVHSSYPFQRSTCQQTIFLPEIIDVIGQFLEIAQYSRILRALFDINRRRKI